MDVEIKNRTYATMIILKEDGKELGHYSLYFNRMANPTEVTSSMCSEETGKGIPRLLVAQASDYLKQLAAAEKKTFVHKVSLVGKDSEEKLPRIFEENGYEMSADLEYKKIYSY